MRDPVTSDGRCCKRSPFPILGPLGARLAVGLVVSGPVIFDALRVLQSESCQPWPVANSDGIGQKAATKALASLARSVENRPMPDTSKTSPKKKAAGPFLSEDADACLTHFSLVVAGIAEEELDPYNADPELVRVNLERGVKAIQPHVDTIREAMPKLPLDDVLELPSLVRALDLAASKVFTPASQQDIRARQARLRPVRRMGLKYLEIVAELDLVPAGPVAAIRANSGPIDEARDGVAISATFKEHAEVLENKHPFQQEQLDQLSADGNWLLGQLTPGSAAPEKGERSPAALLRDRLWTEIQARYDNLYKAGMEVWGRRAVDDHIPALMSRAVSKPSGGGEKGGGASGSNSGGGGTPTTPTNAEPTKPT